MADRLEERDRFGGWTGIQSESTGFFRVEKIGGRWWFITPDGNVFMSTGMNHVDYKEDYSPEFIRFTVDALKDWGFNTIGWTQESLRLNFRKGDIPPSRDGVRRNTNTAICLTCISFALPISSGTARRNFPMSFRGSGKTSATGWRRRTPCR